MPEFAAVVLRSTPSSTSASPSTGGAAARSFSPLAPWRSPEAVRSSRGNDTAAPIDAAPLKGQHRVRVSLIWESLMSHSFGPLVSLQRRTFKDDIKRSNVRVGSKPEKLNASKCFPLFTQQRTSPRYFGMSVSCQQETFRRPQSITSSAPTRKEGGIVTPSALAVFMLITKSKRVGP